jgi:predicted permease
VLQVQAALGRTLAPADEPSSSPDVAVIADGLWRWRFGADPSVVGRAIVLSGKPHTIVGVLPAGFQLPLTARLTDDVEAVVAIRMDAERVGWAGDHNNFAIARLKEGVTPEQARAELNVLQGQVSARATADANETVTLASVVRPLTETVVGGARRGLWLLLGAIGAVLLIACSNLANLALTRAIGRLRDTAIRSALGATRSRLVARALMEQALLSAAGGALGLWVAWAALAVFVRTAPIDLPRVNEITIDGRVLAFAAAISVLAGLVVAVLPAWRTARRDLQDRLRVGALNVSGDRGSIRMRGTLLAFQVAVSMTLLVVTGLLGASFVRLLKIDRGFESDQVLLVPIAMPANRYAEEPARLSVYDRLLAAVHGLPGVRSATTNSNVPLSGQGQVNFIVPEGRVVPLSDQPTANFRLVAPEYFSTLGIAVRRGRPFTDSERATDRPMPSLISESTAERLWPGEDAVGKRFSRGIPGERAFEIVGIVADARTTTIDRTPPLMVYVPYWWRTRASMSLLIKTASEPVALMPAVRAAVHGIDPQIAIGEPRTLDDIVSNAFAARRYQMQLFVAFGIVALLIASLGVYSVTAYGVARRRREMNIRVALGAGRQQVVAMVMRQGTAPVAAGLAAGTAGALAMGGVVASLLFEVRPRDPVVIAAVAAIVAGVGVLACFVAVRRGLVLDPAAALRSE